MSAPRVNAFNIEVTTMSPSTTTLHHWRLAFALILAIGLAGCSIEDTTAPGTTPDPQKAAELASGVQGPAEIGTTLNDLGMFRNPLETLAEDVGIDDDMPLGEGWMDDGVSYGYPSKALMTAKAFRGAMHTRDVGIAATAAHDSPLARLSRISLEVALDKASGDTLAVQYFDTADSTGLDALIETDELNILRLVSQRTYPGAALLQIAERHNEIVLDSNGTLDTSDDDSYFSVHLGFTRANGEQTTGVIEAVNGVDAIGSGVRVRAYHRVDNPSFHILQAWNEAEIQLDPGDFDVEGDETIFELTATVHWRNGAEHTASVAPVEDEAIEPDTDVLISGTFLASPNNTWLQSTEDTLLARLGHLDDESDDLLFEITRSAIFDADAADGGQARSFIRMTPDTPVGPGDEPCGGTAEQDIHYPANWWLVQLSRDVDIECDGSGSMTETSVFQNGTSYTRTITWDGLGAATVTENRPDGTNLSGSFNESTGAYSLVTTYPVGHDPLSRDRHGTAVDGSIEAFEIIEWLDGHDDETFFSATETETQTSITGYRINREVREDFTLTSNDEGDTNGSWTRNDGAEGEFEVDMLEGGGYRLTFSASDPNAEGSPSMSGVIEYAPDGSGTGTVTLTQYGISVTYTVTFGPDGSGTLNDGAGNTIPI